MDWRMDDGGLLRRVSPFRYPWITGYLLLPMAFRSLSRLSSALSAKASTLRSSSLNQAFFAASVPRLVQVVALLMKLKIGSSNPDCAFCFGRMGGMLFREAGSKGYGVRGIDKPFDDLEPLSRASLVIVCIPAAFFEQTLHRLCPHMREDAILCDITSVKVAPMQQMENIWQGSIVGTHPLFGPQHGMDEDLPIALVRGKNCTNTAFELVRDFFVSLGYRAFATDADTHDKAMARIQNMNFITTLAYFALLAGDEELLPYITPSFRRRQAAARKMLTEDGAMFCALFEANPYSHEAVRQYRQMLNVAAGGDIDLLCRRARWWWRAEEGTADGAGCARQG